MRTHSARFASICLVMGYQSVAWSQAPPNRPPTPQGPKHYSSPTAIFEAYREAAAKKDTRTQMFCLVPEIREDVYQAYVGCWFVPDDPEVVGVLKKFGVEASVVRAEFHKRYKAKHGVDIDKVWADIKVQEAKVIAEYRGKHGADAPIPNEVMQQVGPSPQHHDETLYRAILNERIADKVGFVIAVHDAVRKPHDQPNPPGPLRNVRVEGATAIGYAPTTVAGLEQRAGQPERKFTQSVDTPWHFRKTKDGWLISGPG